MADITNRLAKLSPAQRAQLMAKVRGAGRSGALAARSTPDAPASFVQEQMWLLNQFAPGEPAYNVPFAIELTGPLDIDAVRGAVDELLRRHEVLRGRLVLADGRLVQQYGDFKASVPLEDYSSSTRGAVEDRIFALARNCFTLATGPLVTTTLIRIAPEEHVLMWVAHHAVIDGWSYGVLLEEFSAIYRAAVTGTPHTLPKPILQFGDFALWQRERLTNERLESLLKHWEQRLGTSARCEIPSDNERPKAQTHKGAKVLFSFPDTLMAGLRGLCEQTGSTMFTVLLSAFEILVAQYSDTVHPVIGTPIAGRVKPELEVLVGPFSNTVPLRVDFSGDPTFRDILARVSDVLLDASDHQEVPFGKLVDRMQSGRDASRNPLFQVLMNMGNLPQGVRTTEVAPGLFMRPRGIPNNTARVDLELTFEPGEDSLGGRMEYNVDLFQRPTVDGIIAHLQAVLSALCADHDIKFSAIPAPPARTIKSAQPKRPAPPPRPSRMADRTSSWLRKAG